MRHMNAATHLVCTLAVTAAAVLVAFALPLPAQAWTITIGDDAGPHIVGSGKEVDVPRAVAAFTSLTMDGSIDVDAHPGPHPGVTIHADDNIAPLVETSVDGNNLTVRLKKGTSFRTSHGIRAEVEFATLDTTRQNGSGDLHIRTLRGDKLRSDVYGSGDLTIDDAHLGSFQLDIAGSGDVRISGQAEEAHYAVAGSGDIDAAAFSARRVEVSIQGSGDADVTATESIDARVAGSGDVTYRGHPHDVSRRVMGSGSIESKN